MKNFHEMMDVVKRENPEVISDYIKLIEECQEKGEMSIPYRKLSHEVKLYINYWLGLNYSMQIDFKEPTDYNASTGWITINSIVTHGTTNSWVYL